MKDNKHLIQNFFKGNHDEAGHYRLAFWDQTTEPGDDPSPHVDASMRMWDCYRAPITIEFGFNKENPEEKAARLEKLDSFIWDLLSFRELLAATEIVAKPTSPQQKSEE